MELHTFKMRHTPAYCHPVILNVRAGDILAACDFKEIVYLGDDRFAIYYKPAAKTVRKRGFTEAREYYNSLPFPEKKHA